MKHQFVEFIPNILEEETLYISIEYCTATHLCMCGCRNKVITPLSPSDWRLVFNGQTVSLEPSIGNWSFECQSHYWIKNNSIRWAEKWDTERIEVGRDLDLKTKDEEFQKQQSTNGSELDVVITTKPQRWWRKVVKWIQHLTL